MTESPLPTPAEIDELIAFLPWLRSRGFDPVAARAPRGAASLSSPDYTQVVRDFFFLLGHRRCWQDSEYLLKQPERMLANRSAVATASLEQVRTMLTYCKRGENFCAGWWESMIRGGQVEALLERLRELTGNAPRAAKQSPETGRWVSGETRDIEARDPTGWSDAFEAAARRADHDALRDLRIQVFQSTVAAVNARGYALGGEWISLDEDGHYEALARKTRFYTSTSALDVPKERRRSYATQVEVIDADCLEVAGELAAGGEIPAVLNMANRRNPGGGVAGGAGAQEENLFRRSTLLRSLYQFAPYAGDYAVSPNEEGYRYPIPRESGGIYSPPATIFRASERRGYALLERPYHASFITVPAIARPTVFESGGMLWLTSKVADATRTKIRGILRIGAHHGHKDLVLSAFGCGAFRNPPQHIARIFRETLGAPEFEGVFRRIVFAVVNDHNTGHRHNPQGNYLPFVQELGRS